MRRTITGFHAAALGAALTLLGGCAALQGGQTATAKNGPAPGMNAKGEVIDSTLITAGSGRTVQGINDWEGEITGKPFAGAKFKKLKIGMSAGQVKSKIGQPTDEGAYITGKAFIPFYFGSDRTRYEYVYKGQGRLIFASGAGFSTGPGYLTWIIYNRGEKGYR